MNPKFNVKVGSNTYAVPYEDIIYLMKESRRIVLLTKKSTICYYGKMKQAHDKLDERFMFPHRSYIINMDMIEAFEGNDIVLCDSSVIPLGRECGRRARRCYEKYLRSQEKERI